MLLECMCFIPHQKHETFHAEKVFKREKFADRKLHLTVYPAAYSIIALKARECTIVKLLHSHASCRDQKLSFFIFVHGGLFQYSTHCDASGCRVMPKWDNAMS